MAISLNAQVGLQQGDEDKLTTASQELGSKGATAVGEAADTAVSVVQTGSGATDLDPVEDDASTVKEETTEPAQEEESGGCCG
jgi:hypothetical protein